MQNDIIIQINVKRQFAKVIVPFKIPRSENEVDEITQQQLIQCLALIERVNHAMSSTCQFLGHLTVIYTSSIVPFSSRRGE